MFLPDHFCFNSWAVATLFTRSESFRVKWLSYRATTKLKRIYGTFLYFPKTLMRRTFSHEKQNHLEDTWSFCFIKIVGPCACLCCKHDSSKVALVKKNGSNEARRFRNFTAFLSLLQQLCRWNNMSYDCKQKKANKHLLTARLLFQKNRMLVNETDGNYKKSYLHSRPYKGGTPPPPSPPPLR